MFTSCFVLPDNFSSPLLEVANPEDILLFHRKKDPSATASKSRSSKKTMEPLAPEQLEGTNMEDLAHEYLQDNPSSKLMLLSEKKLRESLEDYVDKSMVSSIDDAADGMLNNRQKMLVSGANVAGTEKQAQGENDVDDESPQREPAKAGRQKRKADMLDDSVDEAGRAVKGKPSMNSDDVENEDEVSVAAASTKRRGAQGSSRRRTRDDSEAESDTPLPSTGRSAKAASSAKRGARAAQGDSKRKATRREKLVSLDSEDDNEIEAVETSTKSRPKRASRGKGVNYTMDMDDSDDYQPDAVDDDSDDIAEVVEKPTRKSNKNGGIRTARGARKPTSATVGKSRRTPRAAKPRFDDSDEDMPPDTADLDDDWGTANTRSQI